MNSDEVDSQIDHMVEFIMEEAREKAREIEDAANEEFNLEKLQLLENEKAAIRKEFERKEGQAEVQKKIAYSKYVNEMRLKVLTAREQAVQEVFNAARVKLGMVARSAQYRDLVLSLMVQGLKKLQEPKVFVKCREVDKTLVQSLIDEAKKKYALQYGGTVPELKLNDKQFLNPAPTTENDDPGLTCLGGVVLTSADGRTTLRNTLDDRLSIAYQANLPTIRVKLFG